MLTGCVILSGISFSPHFSNVGYTTKAIFLQLVVETGVLLERVVISLFLSVDLAS